MQWKRVYLIEDKSSNDTCNIIKQVIVDYDALEYCSHECELIVDYDFTSIKSEGELNASFDEACLEEYGLFSPVKFRIIEVCY